MTVSFSPPVLSETSANSVDNATRANRDTTETQTKVPPTHLRLEPYAYRTRLDKCQLAREWL
jgi:hypothetical protein